MDVGNVVLSLRCSIIPAAGRHLGCFGRSPAQLVIHDIPPADREGLFVFKDFPFECKCSCGSSQCGCVDGFKIENSTALLTRPDLWWLT